MKRYFFLATLLASILILAACTRVVVVTPTPAPTLAPTATPTPAPTDPLSLANAYYEAFSAGDIETLIAILADDVVITFPPSPPMSKAEWLAGEAGSFAANAQITFSNPSVEGNTFTAEHLYTAGDHVLTATMEIVVQDGKITSFTVTLDKESLEKLR